MPVSYQPLKEQAIPAGMHFSSMDAWSVANATLLMECHVKKCNFMQPGCKDALPRLHDSPCTPRSGAITRLQTRRVVQHKYKHIVTGLDKNRRPHTLQASVLPKCKRAGRYRAYNLISPTGGRICNSRASHNSSLNLNDQQQPVHDIRLGHANGDK
ncbi:UNVERIFIED_CONTAM: hypothetical protein FKN15_049366 [Acipenser sinensis]